MAKLLFFLGVWLASLINAGSDESPNLSEATTYIQLIHCDIITSYLTNDLLNEYFEELKNLY